MAKVYLETSVISYLTARLSRDIVIASRQQITQEWWQNRSLSFELVASQLVVQEAGIGDPQAAQKRLALLQDIELIAITEQSLSLAQTFIDSKVIPQKATEDALHRRDRSC